MKRVSTLLFFLFVTFLMFAQPVRIACIGNSITYGAFIPNREKNCYPAQLQTYLGDGYEVRNFGVNGCTAISKGAGVMAENIFKYLNLISQESDK